MIAGDLGVIAGDPDPDSRSRPNRETGIPCFTLPAESGIPRFPILAESPGNRGFPPRFPAKSGPGEVVPGERELGTWASRWHGTCHEPHWLRDWLPLLTCVGGRKSAAAFSRIKGSICPPRRDRVWCSWDDYRSPISRFSAKSGIGDSPIPDFGRIGNRGFPDSRPNRESGERELGISGPNSGSEHNQTRV
jgi:hypothetical protein